MNKPFKHFQCLVCIWNMTCDTWNIEIGNTRPNTKHIHNYDLPYHLPFCDYCENHNSTDKFFNLYRDNVTKKIREIYGQDEEKTTRGGLETRLGRKTKNSAANNDGRTNKVHKGAWPNPFSRQIEFIAIFIVDYLTTIGS